MRQRLRQSMIMTVSLLVQLFQCSNDSWSGAIIAWYEKLLNERNSVRAVFNNSFFIPKCVPNFGLQDIFHILCSLIDYNYITTWFLSVYIFFHRISSVIVVTVCSMTIFVKIEFVRFSRQKLYSLISVIKLSIFKFIPSYTLWMRQICSM